MPLSPEFESDLQEVDELLGKLDKRLESLHDLALYEELPKAVSVRLANRRRALELFRTQIVGGLPELAGSA